MTCLIFLATHIVDIATVVAVIVALYAIRQQSKDTHFSLGVQLLREYEKQFDSEEMKRDRAALAKEYLKIRPGTLLDEKFEGITDPIDFFEAVGILLKRRALDIELVESYFSYWFKRYWQIVEEDVKKFRNRHNDDSFWEHCDYLHKQLIKFGSEHPEHRELLEEHFGESEMLRFLKEEASSCD